MKLYKIERIFLILICYVFGGNVIDFNLSFLGIFLVSILFLYLFWIIRLYYIVVWFLEINILIIELDVLYGVVFLVNSVFFCKLRVSEDCIGFKDSFCVFVLGR